MISIITLLTLLYIGFGGMFAAVLGDFIPNNRYSSYDRVGVMIIWPLFVIKGAVWSIWKFIRAVPKAFRNAVVVPMFLVRCVKPAVRYLVFGLPK